MSDLKELVVKILGDTNDFDKKMTSAGDKVEKFGKGTMVAGAALTAGLTLPIIGMGIAAIKAASDAESHLKQTEAVIKSTGGTAGVTVGHVQDLAGSLMQLSGADDDTVQAGENMLLTFTNIKAQGGVFDQATQSALDMATSLNDGAIPSAEQMAQQSMQLGKALNDPATGYAKLQKIGVTFTNDQINQIKTLEKNGDMMGAQKVILNELAKEFGGSAASAGQTFNGKMALLSNTLGNLAETVGGVLLPKLTEIATAATPFVEGLTNAVSHLSPAMLLVIIAVLGAAAALGPLLLVLGSIITAVGAVLPVVGAVAGFLAGPFLLPILAVVAGVALLVAGIVLLIQHWQQVVAAIQGNPAFQFLANTLLPALLASFSSIAAIIQSQVAPILARLGEVVQNNILPAWNSLQQAFMAALPAFQVVAGIIGAVLLVALGLLVGVITGVANALGPLLGMFIGVFGGIVQIISGAVQLVIGIFTVLVGFVIGLFTGDWTTLEGGLTTLKNAVGNILNGLWGVVSSIFTGMIGAVWGLVSGFVSGVVGFFQNLYNTLVGHSIIPDLVNGIVNWIAQLPGRVGAFIQSMIQTGINLFNLLKSEAISLIQGLVNTVVSVAARLQSALTNPIQTAKDIIGGILKTLSGMFAGLHLNLPHIALPHFHISGSFSLNPPSIPSVGVDWYKTGGIFMEPSVVGVGDVPEAVIPLNRLGEVTGGGGGGGDDRPVVFEIDGRQIARAILPYLSDEIQRKTGVRIS